MSNKSSRKRTIAAVVVPAVAAAGLAGCSGQRDTRAELPSPVVSSSSTVASPGGGTWGPVQRLIEAGQPPKGLEVYPDEWDASGGGSYSKDNVKVEKDGSVSLFASFDPKFTARKSIESHNKYQFGTATFPYFEYGEVTVSARMPNFKEFAKGNQLGKPILMLWPENDAEWMKKVEVDFMETSSDAALQGKTTQWINAVGPDGVNLDPNRPNTTISMDDGWHNYTVKWTPESLELFVDDKKTLGTKEPRFIPNGPHRLVLQTDGVSIPDRKYDLRTLQKTLEVRSVTLQPWTLQRDLTPTKSTAPNGKWTSVDAGNDFYIVADGTNVYPSTDGTNPSTSSLIVAVPPGGEQVIKGGKVLDPLGFARVNASTLMGKSYSEADISSKTGRWFAITDGNKTSEYFTAELNGNGVNINFPEMSRKPVTIGQ